MRIKTVRLKHFKRFDDLTINLGKNPQKIIALVGPNGCGKSSIFDAFEQRQRQFKGSSRDPSPSFFSKLLYSISPAMAKLMKSWVIMAKKCTKSGLKNIALLVTPFLLVNTKNRLVRAKMRRTVKNLTINNTKKWKQKSERISIL